MDIYIVYDSHYEDSDIISAPIRVVQNAEKIVQDFFDWLNHSDIPDEYFVYINGHKCINCETVGFVAWLNSHFLVEGEKASIVKQHVKYKYGAYKIDF